MKKNNKNFKIILTGGGTGGSVTPLLAVYDAIQKETGRLADTNFLWIGTKTGIEKRMVAKEGIRYVSIFSGKLRRYFSFQNFFDFFLIILAFFQSIFILAKERPNLIMTAGGFVCVPVVWAGWVLRIPTMIHQQDIRTGLANKLMFPFSKIVTVTFKSSLKDYGEKAILVGNPVRSQIKEINISDSKARKFFNIKSDKPVIFIVGGGTGSRELNKLTIDSLSSLLKHCEIIHVLGKRKKNITEEQGYHGYDFLDTAGMANAYAVSSIVISRCGLGLLTELSFLGLPSILIPMPNSHQEENAKIFADNKAAIVLNEEKINSEKYTHEILKLLGENKLRENLGENMKKVIKKNSSAEIIKIIKKNYLK